MMNRLRTNKDFVCRNSKRIVQIYNIYRPDNYGREWIAKRARTTVYGLHLALFFEGQEEDIPASVLSFLKRDYFRLSKKDVSSNQNEIHTSLIGQLKELCTMPAIIKKQKQRIQELEEERQKVIEILLANKEEKDVLETYCP